MLWALQCKTPRSLFCSCCESIKFTADHCELEGLPVTGAGRHGSPKRINQITAQIWANVFHKVDTKWTTQNGQNESIVYVQMHCINTFRPLASWLPLLHILLTKESSLAEVVSFCIVSHRSSKYVAFWAICAICSLSRANLTKFEVPSIERNGKKPTRKHVNHPLSYVSCCEWTGKLLGSLFRLRALQASVAKTNPRKGACLLQPTAAIGGFPATI